jgi:hypothetical protein
MPQKITTKIGQTSYQAQLNDSVTARAIYDALPIEAQAQRWGGEIYFPIPVECDLEPDSREILNEGELGYWPTGSAFCIFFGPTPMSQGAEIRAASNVNVVGKVLADLAKLQDVRNGEQITINKV